jgi:hypothetical protein
MDLACPDRVSAAETNVSTTVESKIRRRVEFAAFDAEMIGVLVSISDYAFNIE